MIRKVSSGITKVLIVYLVILGLFSVSAFGADQGSFNWNNLSESLKSVATMKVETKSGKLKEGMAFVALGEDTAVTSLPLLKDAKKVSLKFQSGQEVQAVGLLGEDEKRNIALIKLSSSAPPVEVSVVQLTPGVPLQAAAISKENFGFLQLTVAEVHKGSSGVERYVLSGQVPFSIEGAPAFDKNGKAVGMITEEKRGKSTLYYLAPSFFIKAIGRASEPTSWDGASTDGASTALAKGGDQPGAGEILKEDPNIVTLVEFLCDYEDLDTALYIASNLILGMDFLQGVPQIVYDYNAKLELSMVRLNGIETQDPQMVKFVKSCLQGGRNMLVASDLFSKAVLSGQNAQSWNAAAQDLQKRFFSYRNLSNQIIQEGTKDFIASYPVFKEKLPAGIIYDLGVEKRPSIFRIGVNTYAREPLHIWHVYPGTIASSIGLQKGDIIKEAAGRKFGEGDDLEEFKLVLQENLGRTIPITVIRGGKDFTFDVTMPDPIPKQYLY